MKLSRIFGHAAAVAALTAGLVAVPAQADIVKDTYPETPALNPNLPLIHTTHGSDRIKPNVQNPHPVCNAWEDYRTVAYKVVDQFTPAGTISATNHTANPIALTQDLSKTQTINLQVKGDQTKTTSFNMGYSEKGASFGIASSFSQSIGLQASYSLSWNVGQKIGPYDVPVGETGEATYGFRTVTFSGTQQYCKLDGTWSNPTPWVALTPIKNEVRVKTYGDLVGAAPEVRPEDLAKEYESTPIDPETHEAVDAADVQPAEVEDMAGLDPKKEDVTPATGSDAEATKPEATDEAKSAHDLAPYFTVSGAKAPGYAGVVALRAKNVGEKRYYQDRPFTSFRVDVRTEAGPENVDRVITGYGQNGAHIRDLGFNKDKSIRSFEISLSNPIEAGEDVLIGTLHFGDGNTKLGRLKNYITVTQINRMADDKSTANDQNVDSREHTLSDFGAKIGGIF